MLCLARMISHAYHQHIERLLFARPFQPRRRRRPPSRPVGVTLRARGPPVEVTPRTSTPPAMDFQRALPHQTLAKIHGTLAELLQPQRPDPTAVLNLSFSKLSSLITELCNDYQPQTLVDYEALAIHYRAGSEGYPATARPPPPPPKKWQAATMGDSTWDWKTTTEIGGAKPQHEVTSLPRTMNQLRATKIPLDMLATQLLCKGNFSSQNWLPNTPHVGALAGWNREGKILIWVDNGNT